MRRIALLGLTLLLPACESYVGNPLAGFGGFIGDTHTFHLNPNRPTGDAPNLLRAEGKDVEQEPLTPEPGNVWPAPGGAGAHPGGPRAGPNGAGYQRASRSPRPAVRGSSVPPPPEEAAAAGTAGPAARRRPSCRRPRRPARKFYPTPGGTAVGTQTGNGVQTYTDPKGGTGIVVPNGNGTSTLIAPDGSMTTVPTPR